MMGTYIDDCLVCRAEWNSSPHTRQSSIYSDKYQVSYRYGIFSWWLAHSCPKHVEKINKYIKKKLCTKLVLFTRLYRDARSTKHKILPVVWKSVCVLASVAIRHNGETVLNKHCVLCLSGEMLIEVIWMRQVWMLSESDWRLLIGFTVTCRQPWVHLISVECLSLKC